MRGAILRLLDDEITTKIHLIGVHGKILLKYGNVPIVITSANNKVEIAHISRTDAAKHHWKHTTVFHCGDRVFGSHFGIVFFSPHH